MFEVDNTTDKHGSEALTAGVRRFRAAAAAPAALACGLLALTGCVQSAGATQEQSLVYATGDAEPTCLDPHVGGNYPQALLSTQFLEPLFGRDEKGEIVPWLAKSWHISSDGLTVDITLRKGLKFTDGTPLNAEAVKKNIEHLQDPATQSSTGYLAVAKVKSVEVVSPTLARLHMSEPDAAILESLSQQWTAIESPAGLARGMEANCKKPIGTGPFVVDSWQPQQQVQLSRNKNYVTTNPQAKHDGPAYLNKIVWKFVPDAATRFAQLRTGELNVIDNPLPADILQAKQNKGLGISHIDAPRPGSSARLELNSSIAPFDDVRVREAFIRAANPNPGINKLFYGTAKRSYSLLSSVEPWAVSDRGLFSTNMKRAAELLDEAGWSLTGSGKIRENDGQKLSVRIPVSTNQSTPAEQALFEQIQANTAKVGFDVQLQPLDLGTWYERLGDNEYEAVSAPYTKVGSDVLRILYHSAGTVPAPSGYFANHAWLRDAAVDELLTTAARTTDAAREKLITKAQKQIMQSYIVLPLYDQQNHFLVNGVTGVQTLHTISTPSFLDARVGG